MSEMISDPTEPSEATDGLTAAALRAEAWAGEPFLRPGEDPAEVLAGGRMPAGAPSTTPWTRWTRACGAPRLTWRVRYALMLGLERVITDHPPRLASGTELRRHQIDALAGMLTELIAKARGAATRTGTATGTGTAERRRRGRAPRRGGGARGARGRRRAGARDPRPGRDPALPLPPPDRVGQDDRRGRLRRGGAHDGRPHPHAPAPPRQPVRPRPEDRGLRRPLPPGDRVRARAAHREPDHDPDVRLVRAPRRLDLAQRRTSSSSATRRTRRSARRRAPRSGASPSRSTSA